MPLLPPPAPPPASPPYGLAATTFPFPALARLVGQAPLGETREIVLACLLGARLAVALLQPYQLTDEQRRARSAAARSWLGALALTQHSREAVHALYEAAAGDDQDAVADALDQVRTHAGHALDEQSDAELRLLAARLRDHAPAANARPARRPAG